MERYVVCLGLTQCSVRESTKHQGAQEADVRHSESADADDTVLISYRRGFLH